MALFEKKEPQPERFTRKSVHKVGMNEISIMRDNETGVNYIFARDYINGGFSVTPLLDDTGKVYIELDDYSGEETE